MKLRALRDVDLRSLDVETFDGGSIPPAYEPPIYKGPEPSANIEDAKIYTGACHCGAVKMKLKTRGLVGGGCEEVRECSCRVCSRVCFSFPRIYLIEG